MRLANRLLLLSALSALAAAAGLAACDDRGVGTYARTLTSTITLGRASKIGVDAKTPVEIVGRRGIANAYFEMDATITASTATIARLRAEKVFVLVTTPEDGLVVVRVSTVADAFVEGTIKLEVPSYMNVAAVSDGGTVQIESIEGDVEAGATSGGAVIDARGPVKLSVSSGVAFVDTRLPPGGDLDVSVGTGDIEIALPDTPSAAITAQISSGQGQVVVTHPKLTRAVGPALINYSQTVNGGLSTVRLVTGGGRIFLRQR